MAVKTYSYATDKDVYITEHFQVKEFRCKDGTDTILINDDLCKLMERLFVLFDLGSITIYSGYRTPEYSVSVGGYATDQHTKGNAADIICYDKNRNIVSPKRICCGLQVLEHAGGIGLISTTGNTLHVDVRGYKCWFDETRNEAIVNSWTDYFNMPLPGDVNLSNTIEAEDSRLALRASSNLETLTSTQKIAADMDGDGIVSAADARIILKLSAQLI